MLEQRSSGVAQRQSVNSERLGNDATPDKANAEPSAAAAASAFIRTEVRPGAGEAVQTPVADVAARIFLRIEAIRAGCAVSTLGCRLALHKGKGFGCRR